ncbi:MAG: bifunctional phosphopantothenoylcysteine decarboxylase/phosphopantothenate--cysteine ligase CoaBC [Candidatus Obscuribacterales bacterium]|nr:bifunctional phosphopantothenoylcysteine decarboxylase/phosphopantothenate--cysteine ligase CoaBC [Candidatus Obscuribacterales bacterium]
MRRSDGESLKELKPLNGKTIILGVSGGIAAYKSCDLASGLRQMGASVHVVMTSNAKEFVSPLTFQTLTRNTVHCEQFDSLGEWKPEHIELAQKADLLLVAPATANLIAKLATGICDDLLTTIVMASRAKVMLAPAMNPNMFEHPATQHNLNVLENRYRYEVIPPDIGEVACGDFGQGKMASLDVILTSIASTMLTGPMLSGRHILVTGGGTREAIDPVRFIGNRSSGKMGIAMADAAYARGADVTLVSTVGVERPYPVILVETAQDMQEAVESEFDSCDALVMTAAVADFRPLAFSAHKIKKTESDDLVLELTKNPDILDLLGRMKQNDQVIIGFAAESESLMVHAAEKLARKNLDAIVGNDITVPDIGFGSDDNAVVILTADGGKENLPRMPKRAIAEHLCDLLDELFHAKSTVAVSK